MIDPRTTSPLDTETIIDCVQGTGRVVIVDEATPRCSMATDISALIAQNAFGSLKAPIKMVTAPHTPVPFSNELTVVELLAGFISPELSAHSFVHAFQIWEATASKS